MMAADGSCLQWGIAAAGRIAGDMAAVLSVAPDTQHKLVAVGVTQTDDSERVKTFAAKYDIPKYYTSYDQLAEDDNIDIVYVAAACSHAAISEFMMNHGKHVLVELPGAENTEQWNQLRETSERNNVLCMEAQSTLFYPAFLRLQEELTNGTIGEPEHLTVNCQLKTDTVGPGLLKGALATFGQTGINIALRVFGELPEKIASQGTFHEGINIENTLTMYFKGDRTALIASSYIYEGYLADARVYGKLGSLSCDVFKTYNVTVNGKTIEFPVPDNPHTFNYGANNGMIHMADHARDLILSKKLVSPIVQWDTGSEVLKIVEEATIQMELHKTVSMMDMI